MLVGSGASAEVWDPSTGLFSPAGLTPSGDTVVSGTTLLDGRVLATYDDGSARVWDPSSRTFTATGHALEARSGSSTALLQDGRVLVLGGGHVVAPTEDTGHVEELASAEIWDPLTGEFSETGSMPRAAMYQTATTLRDGRVLVVQPVYATSDQSAELFELK